MGTRPIPRKPNPEISLISDKPITIPLSIHQQAIFAGLRAEGQRIADQLLAKQNETVTTIIAATHDPVQFATGWNVHLSDTAITCTPKPKA